MAVQNVVIIGATGNVGSATVRQILAKDSPWLGKHANPTCIVGLANTSGYYFCSHGIPHDASLSRAAADRSVEGTDFREEVRAWIGKRQLRRYSGRRLYDIIEAVARNGMDGDVVFIDATAGEEELFDFHKTVLATTANCIVTANKNPVAMQSFGEFQTLTRDRRRYGMRATVMAGAHTVNHLFDLYDTSESIVRIAGALSGSVAHICSSLERDPPLSFSESVQEAVDLKYMEPNPLDDLDGKDVARKLVVIARCLHYDVEFDDVRIQGVVEREKYSGISAQKLVGELAKENSRFQQMVAGARDAGAKLRYLGELTVSNGKPTLRVGFSQVAEYSALGTLNGSGNKISIETETFRKGNEYVIEAPGAGVGVTASGIRRDLLSMLPQRMGGSYAV